MKVLIENYRNHEIYFDTEENTFFSISDIYDRQSEKKSFASAKKEIDDFIKDNINFKPIIIQNMYGEKITLLAIRKDGRFVYEEKGKKEQFSTYDESNFFLYSSENDNIFD